jgi:hypothetical protein
MSIPERIPETAPDIQPELDPPLLLEPEEMRFYERIYHFASNVIYDTAFRLGGKRLAETVTALGLSWDGVPDKSALNLLDSFQQGAAESVLQQIKDFKASAEQNKTRLQRFGASALTSLRNLFRGN